MRILHLIDGASTQSSETTLAMVADGFGRMGAIHQDLVLLGGSALRNQAASVGLGESASFFSVPWGRAVMGIRPMLRYLQGRPAYDAIHAWSLGAFSLAAIVARSTPRALTLTTRGEPGDVKWLRVLTSDAAGKSPSVVLPISSTLRRLALQGGVPEDKVHVLRPGIDMGRIDTSARASIRKAWGVEASETKVVALLSDPPTAADCAAASMATGLAEETQLLAGKDVDMIRLLVHPDQLRRPQAQRITAQLNRTRRIIQEPRIARPWEIAAACDIGLIMGPDAGGLSLLWAMAGNLTIVGEATAAVGEIVEDRHSALLARPGEIKSLAHRILQVHQDPTLAWKLRDTARHEAFSYFSRQRYCSSLKGVYEQLVGGKAIFVPELPQTGGLKFAAGR